jgi:hypothetical protein
MLGVVLDGFPVKVHGTISSPPIVADVDGDASVDVIAATAEGSVYAFSRRGDVLPGFPLASGKGKQWPAVVADGDSLCLLVASAEDGTIAGWRTGRRPASITAAWPQYQGDIWRSGTDPIVLVSSPAQGPLFPPERAYNWPNPAYGGATNIRFYVREDATVNITVVDMAGDRVTTWTGYARAGLDNEFVWDISGVQSGIYFAHLQATGQTETGHAVIKIAVVK